MAITRPLSVPRGAGRIMDVELRREIERHAMRRAVAALRKEGWNVADVSAGNPYDLYCTLGARRLYVEVKGTMTRGLAVDLTHSEVKHARRKFPRTALAIVSGIRVLSRRPPRVSGGRLRIIRPWNVAQGRLSAVTYRYEP